jgi:tRNA threonylcarbamoyladenosine biosynthesis protein TsaB
VDWRGEPDGDGRVIVLGLDTSTRATVVGLLLDGDSMLEARDDPEGEERPGHATRLLPLADTLLAQAGLVWGDVERIAVGVGPGTFTGLRIGVATARGLAQSLGVDLLGVSSLRALAHAAVRGGAEEVVAGGGALAGEPAGVSVAGGERASTSVAAGEPAGVSLARGERAGVSVAGGERASAGLIAAIDARRGEVFAAPYRGDTELIAPAALSPADLTELRERADSLVGSSTWTAVGDGAVRYRGELELAGAIVPSDDSPLHRVDARAICELGLQGNLSDAQVLPDYRRRPDAEIALHGASP